MPTPLQYVTTRAASYLSEPALTDLLAQAELETASIYPNSDIRNKAVALLTCHWIALGKRDSAGLGISGNLTSESEGQLSRGYSMQGVSVSTDRDLGQTRWGLELIRLRKSAIFNPRTRQM
jgi:hypothetical protein